MKQAYYRTIRDFLVIYLKGLLMGSADIIPGVSGGTIALITRIYTRLIDGITHFFGLVNLSNIKNIFRFRFRDLWQDIKTIDFKLFIPLMLGIITAFIAMSSIIHNLMENYLGFTYAFFTGLIIASAFFLYRQLDSIRFSIIIMSILGFISGFIIVGIDSLKVNHSLPILFFSGSIAITAMILPGISGAFILVMLNQYEHMLNVLRTISIREIIVFIAGALLGLFVFSRLIRYLLHSFRSLTMGFLIGLMIGSLRLQFNIINGNSFSKLEIAGLIISTLAGLAIVIFITRISKVNPNKDNISGI